MRYNQTDVSSGPLPFYNPDMRITRFFLSMVVLLLLLMVPNISIRAAGYDRASVDLSTPTTDQTSSTSSPNTATETGDSNSKPTRTPRPTGTPVPIPPPSDPNTNSMLIGFGIIAVLVVLFGVWMYRTVKI
jgi:hypothetical protein